MIDLGRPYAFDRDFCSSRDVSQSQLFVVVGSECVRSASSMRIRQLVVLINKHLSCAGVSASVELRRTFDACVGVRREKSQVRRERDRSGGRCFDSLNF